MSISTHHYERNVGILVIDVYTASTFVPHGKLEEYSGVSKGKYAIKLEQEGIVIWQEYVAHKSLHRYNHQPCFNISPNIFFDIPLTSFFN